jgi:hypothetical protein
MAGTPYPSLRPACLRSAYAADNPIAIRHRIASERDGRPGSPLRHSSMSCRHSSSSRILVTGICPVRGRPRLFRITGFESGMWRVLQQSGHTGNPVYGKSPPVLCLIASPGRPRLFVLRDSNPPHARITEKRATCAACRTLSHDCNTPAYVGRLA